VTDLTGQRLGQYELHEVVRRGGMATVYKAHQPSLKRWVAVKVLERSGDPQFVARFRREARSVAQLLHPNIVPIFDYGEEGGHPYLVIQYVDGGRTLGDLMGEALEPALSIQLMLHLLEALGYAHERGIVHRDFKPGNVLMPTPIWPMLSDFGIVKLLLESDQTQLTQQGLIVGTAAYMAPEQAFGMPVDARTDLYSVGVVLYELTCGQVPFEADTPVSVLMKQAYEPPPPPRSRNPDLPPALEQILLHALAKSPDDRYPTAADMATDLQQVLAELQPLPAAQREEDDPLDALPDAYAQGVEAFAAGDWEEAIHQLTKVTTYDPGYEDAESLLATALAARDQASPSRAAAPPGELPPAEPPGVELPPAEPAPVGPPVVELPDPAPESVVEAPPAAPPRPSSRASRWWLVVVALLLGFALAGPVVIVQRQLALHRPGRGGGGGVGGTVSMAGLAFKPDPLVVRRGTTVVFHNDDQAPHTVTADSGSFDSGLLEPGDTFSVTVNGALTYHCTIHAFMKARIYLPS
jgi:plastocyanin